MNTIEKTSVILFFVDGVGIGERNEFNPLSLTEKLEPLNNFVKQEQPIFGDGILVPTDVRLGVKGRPQSASGQTSIYTGVNAAQHLGKHKHGFPNEKLIELINERSIFLKLQQLGVEPNVFANVYTPNFFEKKQRWKSATTCSVEAAGIRFWRIPD